MYLSGALYTCYKYKLFVLKSLKKSPLEDWLCIEITPCGQKVT